MGKENSFSFIFYSKVSFPLTNIIRKSIENIYFLELSEEITITISLLDFLLTSLFHCCYSSPPSPYCCGCAELSPDTGVAAGGVPASSILSTSLSMCDIEISGVCAFFEYRGLPVPVIFIFFKPFPYL